MLNRRHIRIKILQTLYAFYQSKGDNLNDVDKQFTFGIEKTYEMYIYLLVFLSELQLPAIERIEAGKNKRLPSKEELHPNTRFVTNELLRKLVNSKVLKKEASRLSITLDDNPELVRKFFKSLVEEEDYKEYMNSPERGYERDAEFMFKLLRRHLVNFELLQDYFEEKSIFWNDDLDMVAAMVLKTLKSVGEDDTDIQLLGIWREDGDEKDFAYKLLHHTLLQATENEAFIKEGAQNWELDRIAVMDIILMKMALAEARYFDQIPLKVTLNEYIELAKYYSTDKSSGFINGILDQLFGKMKKDGRIVKTGRGLIE